MKADSGLDWGSGFRIAAVMAEQDFEGWGEFAAALQREAHRALEKQPETRTPAASVFGLPAMQAASTGSNSVRTQRKSDLNVSASPSGGSGRCRSPRSARYAQRGTRVSRLLARNGGYPVGDGEHRRRRRITMRFTAGTGWDDVGCFTQFGGILRRGTGGSRATAQCYLARRRGTPGPEANSPAAAPRIRCWCRRIDPPQEQAAESGEGPANSTDRRAILASSGVDWVGRPEAAFSPAPWQALIRAGTNGRGNCAFPPGDAAGTRPCGRSGR